MRDSRSRARALLLMFLAAVVIAGAVILASAPMRKTPSLSESPRSMCPGCNVILISIDTLRADHLSCYGYERDTTPEICSFFADGIRFENAYSQSSWTAPAHGSMFTGLLPARHGVTYGPLIPTLTGHPTIFELLHDQGYFTAALHG
ncbi:MAG: sulfatase-like hydrolase/transferase, partial [Polyangiales bacterium]